MAEYQIRILPEVEEFLNDLPSILIQEGYKSNYENALSMLDDILNVIRQLPNMPHYSVLSQFAFHFSRYGNPEYYTFFKRKSSPATTWYIFFSKTDTRIVVKHISTNWQEGHYIR